MPSGASTGIAYWGDQEWATSGCEGQDQQPQIGRPNASEPDPATGAPSGVATTTWYMSDGSVAAAQTAGGPLLCYSYDSAMRVTRREHS